MKRFIFKGMHGAYCNGMVSLGGMRFQIEAASAELQTAINKVPPTKAR